MGATTNHYRALMKKSFILFRRSPVCSCFEIILPALLACILYIVRTQVDTEDMPEKTYYNAAMPFQDQIYPAQIKINQTTGRPILPPFKNCKNATYRDFPYFRNGKIGLAPDNQITRFLETQLKYYEYDIKFYGSGQEMLDYVKSENYGEDLCVGVSFEKYGTENTYDYSLYFNTSGNNYLLQEVPTTLRESYNTFQIELMNEFMYPYLTNGFVTLQTWIDNQILKLVQPAATKKIWPKVTSQKTQAYVKDPVAGHLKGNFAPYIVFPLILTFIRMVNSILTEKEKKIKEGMKIMGMKNFSFYASWLSFYSIVFFFASILVCLVLKSSVFPHSDFSLLLIWHFLFCISLMAQAMFVQVFFSRAKVGNIIAMVFYLVLYMCVFIIQINSDMGIESRRSASLASQVGISLACDVFLVVETTSQGITWGNLDRVVEKFSIGICLYMTVFNIIIFFVLGFYLDQVMPQEFGRRKHWLFCIPFIKKEKKKIQDQQKDLEALTYQQNKNHIEPVDPILEQMQETGDVLKIQNLGKIYDNGKIAVNNLNLNLYKDQITCILGHNGAGKTTTISMLTGMIQKNAGKATVFNMDIDYQLEDIRTIMGVCPQHNILYDMLTVKEHLEMYAVFKGIPSNKINNEIEKTIVDVNLGEKRDYLVKNLSGGQKRKLSVAIAFIGGSKLIYLDEPTSGMDTSARRYIWELLKKFKKDRIIVLTTHFMDEADYLGDRIAIMGGGKLICCGTSVYLKNKFGIGYSLTVVKENSMVRSDEIIKVVMNKVENAKILSNVSSEIQFSLPMNSVSLFENLFLELDRQKKSLHMLTYGISITTMEEVFLQVAELGEDIMQIQEHRELKKKLSQISDSHHQIIKSGHQVQSGHQNQQQPQQKGLDAIQEIDQNQAQQPIQQLEEQNKEIDDFNLNEERITNERQIFINHFLALSLKRLLYFKRDKKGLFCEVFLPCLIVIGGLCLLLIQFLIDHPKAVIDPDTIYSTPYKTIYSGTGTKTDYADIINKFPDAFDLEYYNTNTIAEFDQYNFEQRSSKRLGAYFFDINALSYTYLTEINTVYRLATPLYLNQMNQAIIRKEKGDNNLNVDLTVYPWPYTYKIKNLENSVDGVFASYIFTIGLSFIPASMISFTVKEREEQVKHQQLVSGVSLYAYWLSNFFIDFVKYLFPPCTVFISMIFAFDIQAFSDTAEILSSVCLIFLLYGWAISSFTYCYGFLFKSYGSSQIVSFFTHYIMGGLFPIVVLILRIIPSTQDIGDAVQWILRLVPSYAFGNGILSIGNINLYTQFDNRKEPYSPYDPKIALYDIIFLASTGLFYFILVFIIEKILDKGTLIQKLTGEKNVPYRQKIYDDDVQAEIEKVEKSSLNDFTIRVNKLRKVFKLGENNYNQAVDQVSFGIENGECFTLLGVNGAGKTTTFKILSGDIKQTSGEAHINGYNVETEMNKARYHIGYCPQFDALLDNLTAKEHLELYAQIKGIPKNKSPQLIESKLDEMNLKEYANVTAGTYSGGNKRKLSVAIAMLGNPPIVFLDEPSTGMDPEARRFMWNVISRISTQRKSSSIILTTHSMEEAEALSTKMTIMVQGQLKCMGSVQHIKSKFSQGFEVEVKLVLPKQELITEAMQKHGLKEGEVVTNQNLKTYLQKLNSESSIDQFTEKGYAASLLFQIQQEKGLQIKYLVEHILIEVNGKQVSDFIQKEIGDFHIIEVFQSLYRFKINTNISIGKIFGLFEKNKEILNIANYSVKQSTIEQIFNIFAEEKIGKTVYADDNLLQQQQQNVKQIDIQSGNQQELLALNINTKKIQLRDIELAENHSPHKPNILQEK